MSTLAELDDRTITLPFQSGLTVDRVHAASPRNFSLAGWRDCDYVVPGARNYVLVVWSFDQRTLINSLSCRGTAAPVSTSNLNRIFATSTAYHHGADSLERPTQRLISELRAISSLTNEEIATLVGVSRRALQGWIAGEPISARKDQILHAVFDAIRALQAGAPRETRARLFDRSSGGLRPYDLLKDGRFGQAIDQALARRPIYTPAEPLHDDGLAAQFDLLQDSIKTAPEPVSRRFSRPLRGG